MTENPLISIIVRTKDRPQFLTRALASIAAQTYRPLEAVAINDGGDPLDLDALQAVLGDVALSALQLQQNVGRANAGNQGIAQAQGAYIGFLDDDDEFLPEHIASLYQTLSTTQLAVAYSDCKIHILAHDAAADSYAFVAARPFITYDFHPALLLFLNYIPLICLLFRREVFAETGAFDPAFELYEDWDLLIRLSRTYHFAHLAETTCIYNQWSAVEQITHAATGANAECDRRQYQRILDKHCTYYTDETLYSVYEIIGRLSMTASELMVNKTELEFKNLRLDGEFIKVKTELARLESEHRQLANAHEQLLDEHQQLFDEHQQLPNEHEHEQLLNNEHKPLLNERNETRERLQACEQENAQLTATLSRIYNSKGWRLLVRLYTTRDFIVGAGHEPGVMKRVRALFQHMVRRFVPKPAQFRIKRLLYRMDVFKQTLTARRRAATPPMISIIVPVYNRSAFLRQALESALTQDYDRYEVVAVNDFSCEPEVEKILADLAQRDGRCKVFHHTDNRGISATLNDAILHAQGDYIAFLDCDDYLPPFALRKVVEAIRAHPDLGYFFSDRINVNEQGENIERVTFVNRRRDNYLRELLIGMFTSSSRSLDLNVF